MLSAFTGVSYGWRSPHQAFQRGVQLSGIEAEWAGFALVNDAAFPVDQVHAIWPARVSLLCTVAEFVEHSGKFDPQFAHACACNQCPFIFVLRTRKNDFVADVAFHLPDVAGMRLENVNHEKCDLRVVLVVELIESGNLPPKRWSSIAAEDEHNRLIRSEGRQLHLL